MKKISLIAGLVVLASAAVIAVTGVVPSLVSIVFIQASFGLYMIFDSLE